MRNHRMHVRSSVVSGYLLAAGVLLLGSCSMMNLQEAGPTTQGSDELMPVRPTPAARVRSARDVAGIYDVRAFGATGTGRTIDTPAINRAIEAAAANGGGTVRFPAGTYLCYSIRLKSNITLHLDAGARILAANQRIHGGEGYDPPEDIGDVARYQDFGHSHWQNSLIWGENLENIAITGPGLIDGGLYDRKGEYVTIERSLAYSASNAGRGGGGFGGFGGPPATQPEDATPPDPNDLSNFGGGAFGGGGGGGGITGLSNGIGGGFGGGRGRGGRGGAGRGGPGTQPTTDVAGGRGFGRGGFGRGGGGPGTQPTTDVAGGFGRGGFGRGGGGRGGFGRGGGGGGPFAGALAQLAALNAPPTTEPAGENGGRGRGGGRGRSNTQFTTDLSVPHRPGDALPAGVGNKAISLKLCRNVILSDFSMLRVGHFALLATGVDNLTIDNVKVDTNRDGFDIDSCRNVRVSNCSINSPADDAIVLKSSWGLGYARACENITITNSLVCGGWQVGSMLNATYVERNPGTGRIKFGTESNGGFKNITISNIVFDRCQGLALEAVDGAVIDNVSISNITMREIGSLPIFIRLGNRARMPADEVSVGAIRHVNISDIVAQNSAAQYACIISGIPGYQIEDVRISNVRIIWPGGAPEGIHVLPVPENEYQYPEPGMFGGIWPAYGFFIRHVKGIALNNIEMSYDEKDMRPPFYLEDVQVAEFNNIKAPAELGVPYFTLKDVEGLRVREVRGLDNTEIEKIGNGQLPEATTSAMSQ